MMTKIPYCLTMTQTQLKIGKLHKILPKKVENTYEKHLNIKNNL